MGLKLHEDGQVWVLSFGCIYRAEEEEIGDRNSPGVTQDYIHAGGIDDGGRRKADGMKPLTATAL